MSRRKRFFKSKRVFITKASGERVPFSPKKLQESLHRVGARPDEARAISDHIATEIDDTWDTQQIWRHAFRLLKKHPSLLAAKYNLKRAIMRLGPSGYPFEQYVGKLLEHQGFTVIVGSFFPGRCVRHEIDVLAFNDQEVIMGECKYHNEPGVHSDIKVALATKARFDDVHDALYRDPRFRGKECHAWLITNTRCTHDAMTYAACAGLRVMSWRYPEGESLEHRIEESGLYPITTLVNLSDTEARTLLERGVVLCRDIAASPHILSSAGIPDKRKQRIISEISQLTG